MKTRELQQTLSGGSDHLLVGRLRLMLHRGGRFDGGRLWVTGGWMRIVSRRAQGMAYGAPVEWQTYEEKDAEMVLTKTESSPNAGGMARELAALKPETTTDLNG